MKTYNVIIKGDLNEVLVHCIHRKIELRNPRIKAGAVMGFFAEDNVNENYLNEWFCSGEPSAPYPAGTLLHWAPTPVLRVVNDLQTSTREDQNRA